MAPRAFFTLALFLCGLFSLSARASEIVEVRGGEHKDFGRIAVQWPAPVSFTTKLDGKTLTIHFARPFTARLTSLAGELDRYVKSAGQSANGKSIIVTLKRPVEIRTETVDRRIAAIDLVNRPKASPAKTAAAKSRAQDRQRIASDAKAATPKNEIRPAAFKAAAAPIDLLPAGQADGAHAASGVAPSKTRTAAEPSTAASSSGVLAPSLTVENDRVSLRFDWAAPTDAAIYRRDGALWVIFGRSERLDLSAIRLAGQSMVQAIDPVQIKGGTALRLIVPDGINPSLRRAGTAWILDLKQQQGEPDAPIIVDPRPAAKVPVVDLHVSQAGEPLEFRDPIIGDRLIVVPVGDLGRGVDMRYGFVDFRLLPSIQGIVIRPKADGLIVQAEKDDVMIRRPQGLFLSDEHDRILGRSIADRSRVFDFSGWRGPAGQTFVETRDALLQAIVTAAPAARTGPRLDLARFYFAHFFGTETLAVLAQMARDDPQAAQSLSVQAMTGAACLLAYRDQCAAKELGRHRLDGRPEIALWRGSLAAEQENWGSASREFLRGVALLPIYPKPLRMRFALQAAETMLKTKQTEAAGPLIDLVLNDNPDLAHRAMALFLKGRMDQELGQLEPALALWSKVGAMNDQKASARALYARAMALYQAKKANRSATINALDKLRFAWRGGRFEFRLLRELGTMKLAEGDARGGLEALHEAAVYFSNYPASKTVAKEADDAFVNLFLGKDASDMPPVQALALYDEFHDLEAEGDRHNAIVKKLVDRLVSVDLLGRAATLLENQVKNDLTGRDKARAATQLALLRLMNHQPAAAITALDIDVGKDLTLDLAQQRRELRARALLEMDRASDALATIANDESRDAYRLRADIYWHEHDWKNAARTFAVLVGAPPNHGTLSDHEARLVLSWAATLTLDGDKKGLAKLRQKFGAAMAGTPSAAAFDILAGSDSTVGAGATPTEIARSIAQVGALQNFMAAYKQRVAADKLSAIN